MSGETSTTSGRAGLGHDQAGRNVAIARLVIGLSQGLALWALYRADQGYGAQSVWPATVPMLFAALVLIAAYLPIVLLAGVGRLRIRTLAIWGIVAALALGLLAMHDVARASRINDAFGSFVILPFSAVALFIVHHLIVPADRERRWIAPFHVYFDTAWMAGVQLVLSIGFTGAFWLLLFLGAALFNVIGLKFLGDLIGEPWFSLPLTGLVFATAVHLTDVRDGLIRGVRTVALMLLSWLLLVLTVLVAGFLAALPFTGLDGLWETGSATALVLSAAAALIVLINTAYQDGRPDHRPPVVLRYGVRVASALIAPLVGLAFWGLALRIGQHGLTPDRIIATACAVIGAVYGLGYLFAAVRPGPWMKPLEPTNILAAVLSVATILALFSPLADPARLSAADQVARLERGAVTAKDFDYEFLRFDSGKAGLAALDRLMRSPDAKTAELARVARAQEVRSGYSVEEQAERVKSIRIQPVPGQITPPSFTAQETLQDTLMYVCGGDKPCRLRTLDLDGDGRAEVLLATSGAILTFAQDAEDQWVQSAQYTAVCTRRPADDLTKPFAEAMTVAPSSLPDLVIGGQRLQAQPQISCPPPTPR